MYTNSNPSVNNEIEAESIGFTPSNGHYIQLNNGDRISISRQDYFQVLFTGDAQAVLDDMATADFDDRADYFAAVASGIPHL